MFSAIIRMMDVPTALKLIPVRLYGLTRGGALLMFACGLIILGPLLYLMWRWDWQSTWSTLAWLLGPKATDMAVQETKDALTMPIGENDPMTMSAVLLMLGVGFTLLPTAVQIGLARLVSIPGLGELVKTSIFFDLYTDWGPLWGVIKANTWFDQVTGNIWWLAEPLRVIVCALFTVICSVVLQSAVVLLLVVLFYLSVILVFGEIRPQYVEDATPKVKVVS